MTDHYNDGMGPDDSGYFRNAAEKEYLRVIAERDAAIRERDAAIRERDAAASRAFSNRRAPRPARAALTAEPPK